MRTRHLPGGRGADARQVFQRLGPGGTGGGFASGSKLNPSGLGAGPLGPGCGWLELEGVLKKEKRMKEEKTLCSRIEKKGNNHHFSSCTRGSFWSA